MASKLKMINWAKPEVKKLAQMILDGDRRGRLGSHEIIRMLCERSLELTTGRMPTEPIPVDDKGFIDEVCFAYQQAVSAEPKFMDILGSVYMEVAHHGHKQHLGQFFSAPSIAKLMAMTLVGDNFEPRPDGRLHTALDPAAGSGVMMLAAALHIFETAGAKGLGNWSFTCVDLDRTCALISACQFAINLSANDLDVGELVVIHGNSLFPDECWDLIIQAVRPGVGPAPVFHQNFKDAVQHLSRERGESLFEGSPLAGFA